MGIFGFLKGKRPVVSEVETEKIGFGDVGDWLENKKGAFREDEKNAFGKVGERLDGFYVSVEEKLDVLVAIDIESKKEHERAKILVRQGLDNYINSVRVLLKELTKISSPLAEGFDSKNRMGSDSKNPEKFSFAGGLAANEIGLGEFAVEVTEVFNRFEKTSAIFYGRANYLVGDEMADVRNEIRRFYNGLAEILKESLIKGLKEIGDVKLKLDELHSVEKNLGDVEKEIVVRDKKIYKAKNDVGELRDDVEDMKKSSEYISGMEVRDEVKRLEAGLDREIVRLKEIVDFKRLTGLVHSNEREMGIVKDFRAHFVTEFSKDRGRLLGLLSGCNMMSDEIRVKVDLIEKRGSELREKRKSVGIDYTAGKLKEIERLEEVREGVELENIKGDRRLEKLRLELRGLKSGVLKIVNDFESK